MPVDPTIAIRAGNTGFSLGDVYRDAEALQTSRQQRTIRDFELQQAQAKANRADTARGTLADLILSPGSPYNAFAQPSGAAVPTTNGQNGGDPAPSPQTLADLAQAPRSISDPQPTPRQQAWQSYVRADPEGAINYGKQETASREGQVKLARNLNDAVLGILGSVYDQASYDQGKARARSLYGRYGVNLDDMNLPDQYSPELVHSLQLQALDTKKQLDTMRADRREQAYEDNLDARLTETQRYHDKRDVTTRRGQDVRAATMRRGQDVGATTARRGQDMRGPGRTSGYAASATGPNGERIHYDAGRKSWVNEQGQPVQ